MTQTLESRESEHHFRIMSLISCRSLSRFISDLEVLDSCGTKGSAAIISLAGVFKSCELQSRESAFQWFPEIAVEGKKVTPL